MPPSQTSLYPLKFVPIYKEKVWGGRALEQIGRKLPGTDRTLIGESWELADLSRTSPSGGGDGEAKAQRSVVSNGPLAGCTLHTLMEQYGPALMGRLEPTESGDFPILIKYLDSHENLSVQVHPSPIYAREHPDAYLKSEAWYIVDAEPGAVIYKGVRRGTDPDQFRQAIESGSPDEVTSLLNVVPVKRGACHYLPSGTCHALGAGILVAEVQTPSDTTFRLYDWGRAGRELHVAQGMQCIDFGAPQMTSHEKRSHIAGIFTAVSRLVTCEHFQIEKVRMVEGYEQEIPYDQPTVWLVLEGAGKIAPGPGREDVSFERGETLLLPAHMSDARVHLDQDTVWLEVIFPQAAGQQIA